MKNIIYYLFTCFISTGAMMGAMYSKHPFALYIVGFGIWALFLWGCSKRSKRVAERTNREQLFQNYMRSQYRNPNR